MPPNEPSQAGVGRWERVNAGRWEREKVRSLAGSQQGLSGAVLKHGLARTPKKFRARVKAPQ